MLRDLTPLLVLVALGSDLGPAEDDARDVAARLQGEWVGTALEVDGAKGSEEDAKAFRLTIKSDEMTIMSCRGERCVERKKTFRLDAARSPMWIDLTTSDGEEKGTTEPGIFALDHDELKLCTTAFKGASPERPTDFRTVSGDSRLVLVLKRARAE